jgi:hypothetical protein
MNSLVRTILNIVPASVCCDAGFVFIFCHNQHHRLFVGVYDKSFRDGLERPYEFTRCYMARIKQTARRSRFADLDHKNDAIMTRMRCSTIC